jgi:hypothetical protein
MKAHVMIVVDTEDGRPPVTVTTPIHEVGQQPRLVMENLDMLLRDSQEPLLAQMAITLANRE